MQHILFETTLIRGSLVGIATSYGLDGPEIEFRWWRVFLTCPYRSWGPTSLLYNGYRVLLGGKEWQRRVAQPSPLLMPWSRKSSAIYQIPLWVVGPVQNVGACTRVHFTFTVF